MVTLVLLIAAVAGTTTRCGVTAKANTTTAASTTTSSSTTSGGSTSTGTTSGGTTTGGTTTPTPPPPPPPGGYQTHGFNIPGSHPRLWWNAARITQAKTWLTTHPQSCDPQFGQFCMAWMHVVHGDDCSAAVTWAANTNQAAPVAGWPPSVGQTSPTAVGSDTMRTAAETAYVVYDWCYDQWSATQKSNFMAAMNTWVGNLDQQAWGGLAMPQSNYFLGNLKNDVEWGIASYGDNGSGAGSAADNCIDFGLNQRYSTFTTDAAAEFGGGVPEEGTEYGAAYTYFIVPFATMNLNGRDAYDETGFNKQMAYWMIYNTTPAATLDISAAPAVTAFQVFAFSDDEITANGGIFNQRTYWQDWLNFASNYWSATGNVGKYSRLLYNNLAADSNTRGVDAYIASLDSNPAAATSFSGLPLDFYATGMQYAYNRTAWDNTSTSLMLQMGMMQCPGGTCVGGHSHQDVGNFSMWRGGRWVDRESTGYSLQIAGTPGVAGGAIQGIDRVFAHNVPLFSNVALGSASDPSKPMPTVPAGGGVVNRLESQSGYFYSDVDLTNQYIWSPDHATFNAGVVGHVEREFVYVRGMETLVVLDRILTKDQTQFGSLTAAQVATAFLSHCETNPTVEDPSHFTCTNGNQVARQTVLAPSAPVFRVINERNCTGCDPLAGQYRIEVDNTGAAQRYSLDVIQARDASAANLTATMVDSNPSDPTTGTFTVTLTPASGSPTVIVFNKGTTSSGGSISLAGAAATNFRANVEGITYADTGPVWNP